MNNTTQQGAVTLFSVVAFLVSSRLFYVARFTLAYLVEVGAPKKITSTQCSRVHGGGRHRPLPISLRENTSPPTLFASLVSGDDVFAEKYAIFLTCFFVQPLGTPQ
jgi:hypothetical protein